MITRKEQIRTRANFICQELKLLAIELYLNSYGSKLFLTREDVQIRKPKKPGSIANQILSIATSIPMLKHDCDRLVIRYCSQKEKNYYYNSFKP